MAPWFDTGPGVVVAGAGDSAVVKGSGTLTAGVGALGAGSVDAGSVVAGALTELAPGLVVGATADGTGPPSCASAAWESGFCCSSSPQPSTSTAVMRPRAEFNRSKGKQYFPNAPPWGPPAGC